MFQLLIEKHGGDIKAKNGCGNTPLHDAFSHFDSNDGGDINILTYLINQKNFDADIKGENGRTLLHTACRKIDTIPLEIYKLLIETLGGDVNVQDDYDNTPIHSALGRCNPRRGDEITILMYLLTQKSKDGYTMLHDVCFNINKIRKDTFRILVKAHGADINVQDDNNDTPIHIAFRRFDTDDHEDTNLLTYLINQKDVNVTIKGKNGSTLLHLACEMISKNIYVYDFEKLIETLGADVNAQDDAGDTPIHVVFRCYDPSYDCDGDDYDIETLDYLINQTNLDVNIEGRDGHSLLHCACFHIDTLPFDVLKALIKKHGADPNALNKDKDTPLHVAFRKLSPNKGGNCQLIRYNAEILRDLLNLLSPKGLNGNIKGWNGQTLLHYTCKCINFLPLDVFKVLIEKHGCDVNAQNNDKNTPLHYAFLHFDPNRGGDAINILTYLINQKDVDVTIKDESDHTILHFACNNNLDNRSLDDTSDSAELNQQYDAVSYQIVEFIVERCVQQVLDDTTPLEATTI
jgi:ankyrin repeat protein